MRKTVMGAVCALAVAAAAVVGPALPAGAADRSTGPASAQATATATKAESETTAGNAATGGVDGPTNQPLKRSLAKPAATGTIVKDSNLTQVADIFNGINTFRASKKLPPVKLTPAISAVSQKWSDTLATTGDVYTSPHNPNVGRQIPAGWTGWSEIVAWRSDRSGQGMVDLWIGSPPHNKIMSDPTFTTIGIGVTFTDGTAGRFATYAVVNLATYKSNPSPTYSSIANWRAGIPDKGEVAPPSPGPTPQSTASIPNAGDVVAIDGGGLLWNYGSPSLSNRRQIGNGWGAAQKITVVDWDQDGVQDILVQWKDGRLAVYYGRAAGGFQAPVAIGVGWTGYEVTVGRWNNANPFPSIVARDPGGLLWHYPNVDGRGFGARIQVGTGWNGLGIAQVDWDQNGTMDMIAIRGNGQLVLYRGNGAGYFVSEARPVAGTGWTGYWVTGVNGFRGAGTQGLLARDPDGLLYHYAMTSAGVQPAVQIGNGWGPYTIASHG
ncbi:CAP domain-containing protein [Specibacter cremeus]|uniref:CAP domain-containing protein n=1 Tax=Specibacter cremeus TaxID=1629051 RepID=UPI0013DDE5A1|nr:CAP domain-containing protein [Specibacter cremeus]